MFSSGYLPGSAAGVTGVGTGAGTVAGAHIGPGQDGFPDSEAVRIKQPLNRRFRVEDPQLAVVQNPGKLLLFAHAQAPRSGHCRL